MAGTDRRARTQDPDTARLETFSDGVLAIAITLLVLELDVPAASPGESLASKLGHEWPSYVAYFVSFVTIGIMWVNHHQMFTLIARSDRRFLVLNVIFLLTIATLPWPTALVAENIRDDAARTTATLVYGGLMTMIAIMFNVVWRYAASRHRLLVEGIDPAALRRHNRAYLIGPLGYGTATLVALANAWITLVVFGLLAVYYLFETSGPRRQELLPGRAS